MQKGVPKLLSLTLQSWDMVLLPASYCAEALQGETSGAVLLPKVEDQCPWLLGQAGSESSPGDASIASMVSNKSSEMKGRYDIHQV